MKKIVQLSALLTAFFVYNTGFTQESLKTLEEALDVQVTHAQFLGKTPPLRDLVPLRGTTQERREDAEMVKRNVPNFIGRQMPTDELAENAEPKGVDPVRQDKFNHNASVPIEPLVNIDGMDQTTGQGVNPPDVCGDIGENVFVQMVNASYFQVFDKEGAAISNPIAANTIWSQVGQQSAGDPIILYDQEVNRWIITEFPFGNTLLFAISDSDDPLGSWMAYAFSTPSFPDYPKYSIWPNAYCVTTNENGSGTLVNYFINREEMLNGAINPTIQRITLPGVSGGPGFYVSTPVDWTGATPPPTDAKPMILRLDDDAWGSVDADGITVFEMDIDWDNSANTSAEEIFVPSAAFNTAACAAPGAGFACIPQLGGGGIDGLPEVIMHQVHYRNFGSHEAMVLNFLVNADGNPIRAGIRWMELRRPCDGGEWEVYQEGTYAPDDGLHRFMGGIAMDGSGNIGLGYSFSSIDHHPGLAFTGRKASDPLGEMTVDEYIITEGFSTQPGFRYGDYAQMAVDPANDFTFWYTGEYRKSDEWGTKIFSFELGRDSINIGPLGLNSPVSSGDLTDSEIVEVTIKNYGLLPVTDFEVGYIFENGTPQTEVVSFTLGSGDIYTHTFTNTVDMSAVGDYEIKIFTQSDDDEIVFNDTLCAVRSKLPRFDAGISGIEGLDGQPCGEEIPITIILQNFGTETLTSVNIVVTINGTPLPAIAWTGDLPSGENENVSYNLSGIINGTNDISIATSSPNGMVDEVMINDTFNRDFDALTDGVTVSLLLLTDDYPNETTWELTDESGLVIATGGPYGDVMTLYTSEWCLDAETCYSFTIFDSANDGICCGFGEGSYSIVDATGTAIVSSDGIFGASETLEFCPGTGCQMTADIDISPESIAGAADGAIMITPMNGVGPYMYSIDGGDTFQASNVFDGLSAGDYDIVVMGQGDCLYEDLTIVPACGVSFSVVTTPESNSNSNDGVIEIDAMNGNGTLSYSIDGGETFQASPVFNGLGTGEYEVVVMDELGCSVSTLVVVGVETSTKNLYASQIIGVSPNPTDGVSQLSVSGLERSSPILPVQIYDESGKMVQATSIARYDNVYTGEISVVAYPSGTYFIRFLDENIDRMAKLVKK